VVSSTIGGSRFWLITVMVQLTSTRLVVWKSVDDTHTALHACCAIIVPSLQLCWLQNRT